MGCHNCGDVWRGRSGDIGEPQPSSEFSAGTSAIQSVRSRRNDLANRANYNELNVPGRILGS